MRESDFRIQQTKEWVDAKKDLPTSLMKVLVCYLDKQQNPVVTTAFYVRSQQVPKADKDFKFAPCEDYFGRWWVRSGFYEKTENTYPSRIESRVVAWQPLPRHAVWMVKDLMEAKRLAG